MKYQLSKKLHTDLYYFINIFSKNIVKQKSNLWLVNIFQLNCKRKGMTIVN